MGEQAQIAKLIAAQIIYLKNQTFEGKDKLIESYSQNLEKLGESVKGYSYHCNNNNFNPLELIKIFIHEYIEDATNVLDITLLPDEVGFN